MNTWIFQGNPDRFDLQRYVQDLQDIYWWAKQRRKDMQVGDRVYLWLSAGRRRGPTGIAAVATITGEPESGPDHEEAWPYWRDPEEAQQRQWRVPVHVDRAADQGVLLTRQRLMDDTVCQNLPILVSPRQTNYLIDESVATRIATLLGERPGRSSESASATERRYVARICWNSAYWTVPTGDAAEGEASGSYTALAGFGHEEWLFNTNWLIDGWHYSFLQGLNRRATLRRLEGRLISVSLFAKKSPRVWLRTAEISRCQVLTTDMAEAAISHAESRGWLEIMSDQISQAGGEASYLSTWDSPRDLFNMRFRPGHATMLDPFEEIVEGDPEYGLYRYRLYDMTQPSGRRSERRRPQSTSTRPTEGGIRSGSAPTTYEALHNRIQQELYNLLSAQYPEAVRMEENRIDLRVTLPDREILIEVKSDPRPRAAIREGLGQILEYALYDNPSRSDTPEMIIVGPQPATDQDRAYVDALRSRGLAIRYCRFYEGCNQFEL